MTDPAPPVQSPEVEAAFDAFPEPARSTLLELRNLIFEVAAETTGVGPIEETLKGGQPAYLTPETKSGTTIRLGLPKTGGAALYTHCQTTVMSDFRALFPGEFTFDGNRAVLFDAAADARKLRPLIRHALTYHRPSCPSG